MPTPQQFLLLVLDQPLDSANLTPAKATSERSLVLASDHHEHAREGKARADRGRDAEIQRAESAGGSECCHCEKRLLRCARYFRPVGVTVHVHP